MRFKMGRFSSNRSKSRSVSSASSPQAISRSSSNDSRTPKCSIRHTLGFRRKASTHRSPSPNRQKTESPPPSLPATSSSPLPTFPATVLAPDIHPPAPMPEPTISPPPSQPAAVVFPLPVLPAVVPPSSSSCLPPPEPIPEKTALPSPSSSLPAEPLSPATPLSSSSAVDLPPGESAQPPKLSLKDIAEISWDGFTEVLKVAKESSDWNPFLKSALGGVTAVIDLGKQVKGNSEEMKNLVDIIESLRSTLEMREKGYKSGENRLSSRVEQCAQNFEQEIMKLKEMQTHGKIRRIIQGTSDGNRLLGIYSRIKDILGELQLAIGLSIEQDTSMIRKGVALKELPISVTAPYNANIDHDRVSRRACAKGTRLSVIKPILRWIVSAPDTAPVYWLTGPAGVGKTTIAQTICTYIVSPTGEHKHDAAAKKLEERPLVSFFCSHQLDGDSGRLVPTICRRLADHSSSYVRELVSALEKDSTLPNAKLCDQLEGLLVKPWESSVTRRKDLPLPVIVVDALDENQGGFEFLDLLLKAVEDQRLHGLRFLVTSRTDPKIAARCRSFRNDRVCRLQDVPEKDVQRDINLYLDVTLPEVKDELRHKLATRAGNLFIYASTVVKMTSGSTGSEQEKIIGGILETTSSGQDSLLGDLYAHIIHNAIHHPNPAIQQGRLHVLHTIVCKRALYPNSSRVAIINGRKALDTSHPIIRQLSSADKDVFSAVVKGLHAVMYKAEDGSILTYHASFPDFILRPPSSFSSSVYLNPLCDQGLHHAHLARRCYEIMAERLHFNMFNLESSFDLDEDIPDLKSRVETKIDPVLGYAVQYWMYHLYESWPDEDTLNSIPLCDIPLAFIDSLFLYWLEVFHLASGAGSWRNRLLPMYDWVKQHCPEHSKISDEAAIFNGVSASIGPRSTPHIYISLLSLWKPESHISRMWQPRFPHLPNVALDGQRNPTDITWEEFGPQHSKGDTGDGTLGDGNELVGVPPRRLDRDTGWVSLEDGSRIMWLPHMVKDSEILMETVQCYMVLPELDQISFDFWYLGRNWTMIYEPPSFL